MANYVDLDLKDIPSSSHAAETEKGGDNHEGPDATG